MDASIPENDYLPFQFALFFNCENLQKLYI